MSVGIIFSSVYFVSKSDRYSQKGLILIGMLYAAEIDEPLLTSIRTCASDRVLFVLIGLFTVIFFFSLCSLTHHMYMRQMKPPQIARECREETKFQHNSQVDRSVRICIYHRINDN